jgi:hypothetical protein
VTPGGPARNRVAPDGDIIAAPGRGAWMGNRGRLHEGSGTRDIVRNHRSEAWLTCVLSFRGRRVAQWHPNRYTPLFFLDEAVAFAAGHRPCAECRRAAFIAFTAFAGPLAGSVGGPLAGSRGGARPRAPEIDARLHAERSRDAPGDRMLTATAWADVPDGAFVMAAAGPAVVSGDHLTRYDRAANAYGPRESRPRGGTAAVLTPPTAITVLRAGYPIQIADEAR